MHDLPHQKRNCECQFKNKTDETTDVQLFPRKSNQHLPEPNNSLTMKGNSQTTKGVYPLT